jgi:predicted nucleic acid-binding protein
VKLTVDASIAAKWVLDEPGHQDARSLVRPRFALHAPSLLLAEVGNVMWKQVRRSGLKKDVAERSALQVRDFISVLHAMEALHPRAVRLSLDLDHPIYDCFYLACAEQARAPLLTADRRLVQRLAGTEFDGLVRTLS